MQPFSLQTVPNEFAAHDLHQLFDFRSQWCLRHQVGGSQVRADFLCDEPS